MCFDRPPGADFNSNDECPHENWTHVLFWHITNLTGALRKGIAILIVIHKTCPPIIFYHLFFFFIFF